MAAMSAVDRIVEPDPRVHDYHERKHRVFLQMYEDQMRYRLVMEERKP